MASHTRASLDDLRDIATRVAREAGDFALTMRRAGVDIAGSKSSAVDIVTKADQATEKLIRERLA
jgi:myo-inositol-1(or 4)-monophosphatase